MSVKASVFTIVATVALFVNVSLHDLAVMHQFVYRILQSMQCSLACSIV